MSYEAINRYLDGQEEQMIGFLQEILRIPSVTGDEARIQEFISAYTARMGQQVDVFVPDLEELKRHPGFVTVTQSYDNRPNVVSTLTGMGGGRSLLFNGHIDVIPEGPAENWEHGCWSADIADGRIYGRGAADMKSGVAAMTMAVQAIIESGIRLKGDVITEYVMDEELSGNGTLDCCIRGYKGDAGICCETSSMRVQPGSIGRIWFEIRIKGKAAGIQRRYEGINAIDLGYLVTQTVVEFEKVRVARITHPLYPDILGSIPCMVGQFVSGSYASAFPDACVLKGSLATVPGEDSDQIKTEFTEFIIQEALKKHPWFYEVPPEVLFVGYFAEPAAIDPQSPIVIMLKEHYKNVLGKDAVVSGREGAADIRHLIRYADTPTVIFGPGATEQMHANNEWVSIRDYLDSIRILAHTILDWCEIAEPVN